MPAVSRTARAAVPCLLLAGAAVGCSSSAGQTLGLAPPQHRLLSDAKAFREGAGTPELPRELAKALHPAFVVEPGDVLLVQPVEFDAPIRLTGDQPVLPDGTIDLGKYGRPTVAGKTLPVIEAEVQQLIKGKEKEPVPVTVRLINRTSKVYYVLGEVNAPGAFPINGRETALDAIIAAGGLTRKASERNIILSRPTPADGCRVVFPICYSQIVQLGDTTTNHQLMAGDRIFVPSKAMLEDLCSGSQDRKSCGACDKPQVPCANGRCADGPAGPAPVPAPATLAGRQ
jgi:protein involved in polysaccharide export with SLBB domain